MVVAIETKPPPRWKEFVLSDPAPRKNSYIYYGPCFCSINAELLETVLFSWTIDDKIDQTMHFYSTRFKLFNETFV